MASSTSLVLFALSLSLVFIYSSCEVTNYKEIHLGDPVLHLAPLPLDGYSSTRGAKDVVSCGRVRVAGIPRWKIRSYANSARVTLTPSVVIPENLYSKIEVCFHRNSSLGLCQCAKDDWKSIQKGLWSASMSPYDDRYIDVKFNGRVTGSVTVTIEEEFHQWRLIFLAFGFILLLLAPVFSKWVPFYYSSSMAIGVFLIILILLFQIVNWPEVQDLFAEAENDQRILGDQSVLHVFNYDETDTICKVKSTVELSKILENYNDCSENMELSLKMEERGS